MPTNDMTTPLIKPTPRRAQRVEKDGPDAGQVRLKKEMIEICQEMINLLATLGKKEDAFYAFQQQLLEAAQNEGWPVTVPAETDVAESAFSTKTKAGGGGGSGALLETSSTSEEASAQTDVPSSPEEHLAALKALDAKINQLLNGYRTALPDSVSNILFHLQVQVKRSISAVEKDIAAEKQQAFKAQVAESREATLPAKPGLFAEPSSRELERSHSCPPDIQYR
ncbi:MAG: hypothetical protein P1U39_08965 [Legionellaceae bacterium]|nr:hypothetical protein [Legionellaceae bacterium]